MIQVLLCTLFFFMKGFAQYKPIIQLIPSYVYVISNSFSPPYLSGKYLVDAKGSYPLMLFLSSAVPMFSNDLVPNFDKILHLTLVDFYYQYSFDVNFFIQIPSSLTTKMNLNGAKILSTQSRLIYFNYCSFN